MKKLAIIFSIMFTAQACAQTEHDFSDVPPTYDVDSGQFFVDLPMMCTTDEALVFDFLNKEGYKLAFLGEAISMAGGGLQLSVFVHPITGKYYTLLTNSETGGVCEVTSGPRGQVFNIDDVKI